MKDHYNGSGYHEAQWTRIPEPGTEIAQELASIAAERDQRGQYSEHVYESMQTEAVLQRWDFYDRVVIKSWDFTDRDGVSGSIARFENTRTRLRTQDWQFTIRRNGFQRLKPNMDYLRQVVDCALSKLDSYTVGGITRYTGVTSSGDFQLITTRIGAEYQHTWISIADRLFIPVATPWQQSTSRNPSLDTWAAIAQPRSIAQAIDDQDQDAANGACREAS